MRARPLLAVLTAAFATHAGAVDLNVISAVEVVDAGAEVVLTIRGTKRPSFTTFSMADEPRFVIDFSESKFQNVPAEMGGAGGIVKLVRNLSYGSDASSIARVIVVFTVEVDPPAVEDSGTGLVVRIAKPGGAAAVAAAPAADPDAKAKADADAKAKADADARAKADAEAKAKADAEAAKAAREAQARADADADAKAKADADARAKADAEAKAKADAEAAKAAREAQAKADADAKAKADADAKRKADADARAKADADAKAKAAAAAQEKGDEQRTLEAELAAAEAARAEADEQKALEAEIAAAREDSPSSRKAARSAETLSPDAPSARLREVGFQQLPNVSRIFVRTSAAVPVRVTDVDEETVQIEVENTRATRYNDLRFLDTSFFTSAVQKVTPSRQGTSYVLTVKLRQRVPYAQKVEGDMVAVDFQRPPAPAGEEAATAQPLQE